MFLHVPLRDIKLSALRTLEWLHSQMLPQVNLQIASRVVLPITAFVVTLKLIIILVCPFVVT